MKKLLFVFYFLTSSSLIYAQWTNTYNGQGDKSSGINASAPDLNGNVYLCGFTTNIGASKDIMVLKLNSAGDTLWTNVYDGPGNGMDEALAIVVDQNSNSYITGYQRGSGTGTDMVTIKYNAAGQRVWVKSYISNINSDQTDKGNAIAVDQNGNVYVTGQSDSDATSVNNDDYVTIKYSSTGTQTWIAIKNGSGNGTDRAVKIVLDATNNVYVTGRSFNGAEDDYLTIKYNGTNGTQVWQQLLDRTRYDRPTDMVINRTNGNIYVTGRSKDITYDYVTVAYNSTGTELWQAIYDDIDDDRATGIAINANGELFVTGQSDVDATTNFNYNITTVKYSTAGVQQWVKTYAGSALNDDIPTDICVDATGNVFVTGFSDTDASLNISNDFVILGYTGVGNSIFSTTFTQNATSNDIPTTITTDNNNNVIVSGSIESIPVKNAVSIKYNPTGQVQWNKKYASIGDNSSNSHAIAIDNNGNTFVAGYTVEYNADRNFSLQKIDPNGTTVWLRTLNGTSTSGSIDEAFGVAIDATGNIFVGGYIKNTGTSYDYLVAKYNQAGDTLWTRTYDYPTANGSDKGISLALDNSGNVYLTGRSDSDPNTTSNIDVLTIKWDTNGNQLWAIRYNNTSNNSDLAKVMKISSTGNVYVAGRTFNGTNYDFLLLKYNSTGVQQWVKTIDGTGNDAINSITLDNSENIYLTGYSQSSVTSDTNIITVKCNASGVVQWSKIFDGTLHGNDVGKNIVLDNLNNVIICGTTDSDASSLNLNNDIVTIKYDNAGTLVWQKIYNNTSNFDDQAEELRVDANNNIYVTGESDSLTGNGNNYDYVTLKYSSTGNLLNRSVFNGSGNNKDIPSSMEINSGFLYVTGGSLNTSLQRDIVTIRYKTEPNAGIENTNLADKVQIYPNPFSDFCYINIEKLQDLYNQKIHFDILNILGERVLSEEVEFSPIIKFSKMNLKPGVYYIKLENQNNSLQIIIL